MTDYKSLYFKLYGAICDALDALESSNYGTAMDILKQATTDAEMQYLEQSE